MASLLTGGAGFIGSHCFYAMQSIGEHVIVLDDLSAGFRKFLPDVCTFYQGDAGDQDLVRKIIKEYNVDTVIHMAGSIIVSESVEEPGKYYKNNSGVTLSLLEACAALGVKRFIFSSTASVYGNACHKKVVETDPTNPINPYAMSKLVSEAMIKDFHAAYNIDYAILRYFNVAGADAAGRSGQVSKKATHLIKVACEVLAGKQSSMFVFGDDYGTDDGTCVRDYIHVSDLADAHVSVFHYLKEEGEHTRRPIGEIFNCGYGMGYSVLEVIRMAEEVSGQVIPTHVAPRRLGDVDSLMADASRLREKTKWQPRYNDLRAIIASSLTWEKGIDHFFKEAL